MSLSDNSIAVYYYYYYYFNLQLGITFVATFFSHFQLLEKKIFVSREQRIRVGKYCTHKSSQFDSKVEEHRRISIMPWRDHAVEIRSYFFFFFHSGCRGMPPLVTTNHPHKFSSSTKYSSGRRKIKRSVTCFDRDSFRIPQIVSC